MKTRPSRLRDLQYREHPRLHLFPSSDQLPTPHRKVITSLGKKSRNGWWATFPSRTRVLRRGAPAGSVWRLETIKSPTPNGADGLCLDTRAVPRAGPAEQMDLDGLDPQEAETLRGLRQELPGGIVGPTGRAAV